MKTAAIFFNKHDTKNYSYKSFTIYEDVSNGMEQFISDLENAKKSIYLQYFIINNGILWKKISSILLAKKGDGLDVKVIYDYVGFMKSNDVSIKELIDAGIEVVEFNKVDSSSNGYANYRSHNKFLIIDNKIGYTGGANIGDDYVSLDPKYGYWIDTLFRVKGEIINFFNLNFIYTWYLHTDKFLKIEKLGKPTSGTGSNLKAFIDGPLEGKNKYYDHLIKMISNSRKSLKIVTPYFIVPQKIISELKKAKNRGVKIEIITLGLADKLVAYNFTKYYLDFAISKKILEVYQTRNIFMHSKFIIVDDKEVVFGTSNLDYRSFYYHFESNLISRDAQVIAKFEGLIEKYKKFSFKRMKPNKINNILIILCYPFINFFSPIF